MVKHYSFIEGAFEVYRDEFSRRAELRLSHLRDIEAKRLGRTPVSGADIEKLRTAILKCLSSKARLSYDIEYIEDQFSAEQRRSLYILLADLAENIPWRFPWQAVMNVVNEYLEIKHSQ